MDLGLSNRVALAFGAAGGLGGAIKPVLAGAGKLAATETRIREHLAKDLTPAAALKTFGHV